MNLKHEAHLISLSCSTPPEGRKEGLDYATGGSQICCSCSDLLTAVQCSPARERQDTIVGQDYAAFAVNRSMTCAPHKLTNPLKMTATVVRRTGWALIVLSIALGWARFLLVLPIDGPSAMLSLSLTTAGLLLLTATRDYQ